MCHIQLYIMQFCIYRASTCNHDIGTIKVLYILLIQRNLKTVDVFRKRGFRRGVESDIFIIRKICIELNVCHVYRVVETCCGRPKTRLIECKWQIVQIFNNIAIFHSKYTGFIANGKDSGHCSSVDRGARM